MSERSLIRIGKENIIYFVIIIRDDWQAMKSDASRWEQSGGLLSALKTIFGDILAKTAPLLLWESLQFCLSSLRTVEPKMQITCNSREKSQAEQINYCRKVDKFYNNDIPALEVSIHEEMQKELSLILSDMKLTMQKVEKVCL